MYWTTNEANYLPLDEYYKQQMTLLYKLCSMNIIILCMILLSGYNI